MLKYMIMELFMRFRIVRCEILDRYYTGKAISMALKKERAKKQYKRFRKENQERSMKVRKYLES